MLVVSDYTALISGYTWRREGQTGLPVALTYSFDGQAPAYVTSQNPAGAATFRAFPEFAKAAARIAMQTWAAAAGVSFVETKASEGDIVFGAYDTSLFGSPNIAAFAYLPSSGAKVDGSAGSTYFGIGGDVFVSRDLVSGAGSTPDLTHVLLHEIGHALGLKHPFDGPDTLTPTLDNGHETVMSYGAPALNQLGPLDVSAVRYLYGPSGSASTTQNQPPSPDDTFDPGPGTHNVDGGVGIDTLVVELARRESTVAMTGTDGTVSGPGIADRLTSIERISFIDGTVSFSADTNEAQAARLYQAAFDRARDAAGVCYWADALHGGRSPFEIAGGFIASAEFQQHYGGLDDAGFATALYRNVLHRAPDALGLESWTRTLDGTAASRSRALVGFAESVENRANTASAVSNGLWSADPKAASVARLYYTALGRAPDGAGLAAWTTQLQGGHVTLAQQAAQFVTGQEFVARYGSLDNVTFVRQMYQNVLGRAEEPAGVTTWLGVLAAGGTRGDVATGFSESTELQARLAPVIEQDGIVLA
jgi:hypothetical protein